MPWSKSPLAFRDVQQYLDRALTTPHGIRIPCPTRGGAFQLRSRCNYYRQLDRQQNKLTYDEDHPMHGNSPYDDLVISIRKDDPHLYITPRSVALLPIEELTEDPGVELPSKEELPIEELTEGIDLGGRPRAK